VGIDFTVEYVSTVHDTCMVELCGVVTVHTEPDGEITGIVQDETGNPLHWAKVTLRDVQDQLVNSTCTDMTGFFAFKAAPGKYYVEVILSGYKDYKGNLFTVESEEIEDLGIITLHSKAGTLIVTVKNEKGEPLDATVTVRDTAGTLIDTITVTGRTASVNILAGTYSLEADAGYYLSHAVVDVLIESGVTVSQNFVLKPAPGSIKVHTKDTGRVPISDAVVSLNSHYVGATDETGWLTISDISPGSHTITVVKEGFTGYEDTFEVFPAETLILELTMEKPTNWSYILVLVLIVGVVVLKYAKPILSAIFGKSSKEKNEYV
jgi:hypothetical protein